MLNISGEGGARDRYDTLQTGGFFAVLVRLVTLVGERTRGGSPHPGPVRGRGCGLVTARDEGLATLFGEEWNHGTV